MRTHKCPFGGFFAKIPTSAFKHVTQLSLSPLYPSLSLVLLPTTAHHLNPDPRPLAAADRQHLSPHASTSASASTHLLPPTPEAAPPLSLSPSSPGPTPHLSLRLELFLPVDHDAVDPQHLLHSGIDPDRDHRQPPLTSPSTAQSLVLLLPALSHDTSPTARRLNPAASAQPVIAASPADRSTPSELARPTPHLSPLRPQAQRRPHIRARHPLVKPEPNPQGARRNSPTKQESTFSSMLSDDARPDKFLIHHNFVIAIPASFHHGPEEAKTKIDTIHALRRRS